MLLKLAETDIHRRFFFWFSPQNNIVFPQSIVEMLGILNNSLTSMIIYRLKIHVSSSHQIKSFTWITNVIGTMSISVSICYHCSFHIMVQLKQTISIKQWKVLPILLPYHWCERMEWMKEWLKIQLTCNCMQSMITKDFLMKILLKIQLDEKKFEEKLRCIKSAKNATEILGIQTSISYSI